MSEPGGSAAGSETSPRSASGGDDQPPVPGGPGPARSRPRISDVAAAAGVSKALVSYALNDRPGVSEATRERIIEVARTLGWSPSVRARALSHSRAYAVGLVFRKDPQALAVDQYYTSLMAGMQAVLSGRGYSLVTEVVPDAGAEAAAYRRLARDGRVDGVVLADLRDGDPRFAIVRSAGLAFVCLGEPPPPGGGGMPVLRHDEGRAADDVVAHLAGLGHRRIAQVAGPQELANARRRRELFQQSLRVRGIEDGWWVEGDYTAAGGRAATARLLGAQSASGSFGVARPSGAGSLAPTAILYSNDLMAVGGMGEVLARGLQVPTDVSIVGWDDIVIAPHLHPALSTVRQYPFEDGGRAAAALLDAISGTVFEDELRTPDPSFVPRRSTGPAPA